MAANKNNDNQERIKKLSERAVAYYYNDLELSDPQGRLLNRPRTLLNLPSITTVTTGRITNTLSIRDHYRIFSTPTLEFINPEVVKRVDIPRVFKYKGVDQTFTAGPTTYQVEILAWGGGGSGAGGGGAGAFVSGLYSVIPGKQLRVVVGGGGWPLDASGINARVVYGGGGGRINPTGWGNYTNSGGGLSGVFDQAYTQQDAICVAGAGGGGGTGGNARWFGKSEDGNATLSSFLELCPFNARGPGEGGSQIAGGRRGCSGSQYGESGTFNSDVRAPGSALQGGWGFGPGSSGGGGYFGGGGGAFFQNGGAGSSYTGRLIDATGENGANRLTGGRTNPNYIAGIGNGGGNTGGGGAGLVVIIERTIFRDIFKSPPV